LGLAYRLNGSVHDFQDAEHGDIQECMILEKLRGLYFVSNAKKKKKKKDWLFQATKRRFTKSTSTVNSSKKATGNTYYNATPLNSSILWSKHLHLLFYVDIVLSLML
jgi:hypothetical protein